MTSGEVIRLDKMRKRPGRRKPKAIDSFTFPKHVKSKCLLCRITGSVLMWRLWMRFRKPYVKLVKKDAA